MQKQMDKLLFEKDELINKQRHQKYIDEKMKRIQNT